MLESDLTAREFSVIGLLRKGKPNKVIATSLKMQDSTVKVHVRNILRKLHATNRTQAAIIINRRFGDLEFTVLDSPAQAMKGNSGLIKGYAETQAAKLPRPDSTT